MEETNAKKIWEEVKRNKKRLDQCNGPHEFVDSDKGNFFGYKRCKICRGEASVINVLWYERGIEHGRKH